MHTGTQRKYVRADGGPARRVVEDGSSLLDWYARY